MGYGSVTPEIAAFLSAAVAARKNIMIAGATNAGKTTLLRALANEIPSHERIITVERALEPGPGRVRGPAPERRGVRGAAAELRGPRLHLDGRPGAPLAAHEPEPGHRRRGARRRDRHHAERDEPGQRRLAVDDPREQARWRCSTASRRTPSSRSSGCRSRPR
nr:ATPase, T2SS/T4P/T4SS family [Angustibacter aerolatus]